MALRNEEKRVMEELDRRQDKVRAMTCELDDISHDVEEVRSRYVRPFCTTLVARASKKGHASRFAEDVVGHSAATAALSLYIYIPS